jgi:hypothetical protein
MVPFGCFLSSILLKDFDTTTIGLLRNYSDCVTEAQDANRNMFEEVRLHKIVNDNFHLHIQYIGSDIIKQYMIFPGMELIKMILPLFYSRESRTIVSYPNIEIS